MKQFKDMKDMAHEAPGLLAQTAQLSQAAQANGAAQQAAAAAATASAGVPHASGGDAIAGVDLALYVAIARSLADVGYDQARGPEVAARHGVSAPQWQAAVDGWNARIAAEPAVASRFNALYTGR